MKIFVILLTAACLQVSARGKAQGISLSVKNAKLEQIFSIVEQQSAYRFIYSQEAMQGCKPISITADHEELFKFLKICFANQPLSYTIDGKYIIVKQAVIQQAIEKFFQSIKGRVVNESGEKLPGVTVTVKGTTRATVTDNDGVFELDNVVPSSILIISGAEVETKEIAVKEQGFIAITVKSVIGVLNETIVKGYYNTSRKLNTGTVEKIGSKEISNQPVSNPLAALQGRVAGLLVTQQNGIPGSAFNVLIRGRNSITSGNSPLYIINGVPFLNDAEVLTQRGGTIHNSPFNTINPLDIESIEILKDADATAIYGSKGANGVIVITTKKTKPGKTSVDASTYYGLGWAGPTVPLMNTQQYLEMRREAFKNDNVTPTVANAKDLLVYDTTSYTDLKKLLIGNTAHVSNTNIRLNGGSDQTRISAGVNYYTESTVFYNGKSLRRFSADLSTFHRTNDNKLNISINASFGNTNNQLVPADLTQFINLSPDLPALYDSLGRLNWKKGTATFNNPLANTLRDYDVVTDRLTGSAMLSYQIIPSLFIKASLGYNRVDVDEKIKTPIVSQDPAFAPTGNAFFGKSVSRSWNAEPQLEYSFRLKPVHKFQLLAGMTWRETKASQQGISATGYVNDNLLESTVGASSLISTNGFTEYRYNAMFGRINYSYKDKYLVNLTGRRDGSSRFGSGHRFANFGAVGIGWVFTDEKFIRTLSRVLNYGKFRASAGTTGNDLISDYQYLDTYSGTTYPYQGSIGLRPTRLFNPDYSWEQINKTEIALELGFWKSRLLLNINWFNNKSRNQIISYNLPGQTGFTSILRNFPGVVRNRGLEFSLSSVNFQKAKFKWSTSFNITFPRNKLLAFPGIATSSYATQYIVGKPLNLNIGYHFLGVDSLTGIYKFDDINKDNVLNSGDYQYLGTKNPKYYGGLSNSIEWKSFDVDFLFEFRNQLGTDPVYSNSTAPGNSLNQPAVVLERWQKPGDNKPYQRFTQAFNAAATAMTNMFRSDAALTDASYVRFKNIAIGYSLPGKMMRKIGIQKCRVYLLGQNLFIITNYLGNPETQSTLALPPLKILTAGIQINF